MNVLTSRALADKVNEKKINLNVPGDYLHTPTVAAKEIIDEIVSNGGSILYENCLLRGSIPHTVNLIIKSLFSLVEVGFMRREPFETEIVEEDPEPAPSSIDAWARNQVRTIAKCTKPQPELLPQSDRKLISTLRPKRSNQRFLNKTSKASQAIKRIVESPVIDEKVTPIPETAVEIDNEIEELRKRKEFSANKIRAEREREINMMIMDEELEKKLEMEAEMLKDKQLTFDCSGKVIFVSKPELGDIFKMCTPLRFSSLEPVSESKSQKLIKKKGYQLNSMKKPGKTQAEEKAWVRNVIARAPPLLDHIELSPNVTLNEGQITKLPPKDKTSKMTRKKYFSNMNNSAKSASRSFLNSQNSDLKMKYQVKDIFESIPVYERLNEDPNEVEILPPRQAKSISPISKIPHGRVVNYFTTHNLTPCSPQDYFNMQILNSQLWGMNPPQKTPKVVHRKPIKIGPKEMRELFGNIVKKPKDHPFLSPEELWKNQSEIIKKPKDRPYIDKVPRR